MEISTFRTDGLGDSTYLLIHDGVGVVVDPQRDVERFEQAVAGSGIELCYVLETHIHNDYVSGGRELARRTGAQLVLPAAAGVAFDHLPAFHTEDLGGDGLVIRPLHTPGHTPEHMSYLILVDGEVRAVFSGGSLLVGSAGRSDLLGDARAEQLARLQYLSVRSLAELPDETALYPTHGEGSFCTASSAGQHTSTIGVEKLTNPVLAYESADAFAVGTAGRATAVSQLLRTHGAHQPARSRTAAETARAGTRVLRPAPRSEPRGYPPSFGVRGRPCPWVAGP